MSELERTLESIRDIGPQRATPSSVARIQAQAKQLAAEVDELRDREVSVGLMDDFADMAKQIAALREENERLKRVLDIALDALSKARRDIKEHLQVAKWNLNGEVIPGETIDPPITPSLIHQSGIQASERVVAEIERAMKIGIGTLGALSATSGESEE